MLEHRRRTLKLLVLGLAFAAAMHASVVETYTGNHFNFFVGPGFGLDTSNFIVAHITLAAALPANLNQFQDESQVLDWSITDGLHTLQASSGTAISNFVFSTDASGAITSWVFGGDTTTNGIPDSNLQIVSVSGSGFEGFIGTYTNGFDESSRCCNDAGFAVNVEGTWTASSTVPEPGSVVLTFVGIASLLAGRFRYACGLKPARRR